MQIKIFGAALICFSLFNFSIVLAGYDDLNLIKSNKLVSANQNIKVIPLKKYMEQQSINPGAKSVPLIQTQPLKPLPTKEVVTQTPQGNLNRNGFYFEPGYGRLDYATTKLQPRQSKGYNKFSLRLEPRLGYRFYLGDSLTLEPYLGGEILYGGDQEEYFNHVAPALGLRTKPFRGNNAFKDGLLSLIDDFELYVYQATYSVLNDKGPDPLIVPYAPFPKTGPNDDTVYGFRFYKELKQKNLWQDWYFRMDHRQTDFRATNYDDWLILSTGKMGFNFNENKPGQTDLSIYYGFETFKNLRGVYYFQNTWVNILGFHYKFAFDPKGQNANWMRFFAEYRLPIYMVLAPYDIPQNDIQIGVEFWNQ